MDTIAPSSKRFSATGASMIVFWKFWNMFLAPISFRDAGISSYQMRDEFSCIIWPQQCVVKKLAGRSDFLSWNNPFCGNAATLADSLRRYFKGFSWAKHQVERQWSWVVSRRGGKCGLSSPEAWDGKRVWYSLQSRCVILSATQTTWRNAVLAMVFNEGVV